VVVSSIKIPCQKILSYIKISSREVFILSKFKMQIISN